MIRVILGFLYVAALSGCEQVKWPRLKAPPTIDPSVVSEESQETTSVATPVPENASTVDDFDTTSEAERSEAQDTSASVARDLGTTVASLGAPTEPGFWLKTPLVDAPRKGRVEYPTTGQSVEVDLIPIDGPKTAGSRISLSALRLLGAPLTELSEVRVFLLNK